MTGGLRLRVLGSSPSVPRPGRACSSYLLRSAATSIVLDAGSGAVSALRTAMDYAALDAVIITHMHADHFLDIIPLRYGLTYGPSLRSAPLPLWLPPGGSDVLQRVCAAFAREGGSDFLAGFDIREYDQSTSLTVGEIGLRFARVRHYIDAFAVRAESGGATLTYSGDSAPCDELVDLARDVDLLLCEAALGTGVEDAPRGHLCAREAGEIATAAGVRALALTHYPAECAAEQLRAHAIGAFDGPVTIVDDGFEVALGGACLL
ncbi:MAG: MBL fold metallo-hydrolase [Candidatus Tumulicola sp.]